MKKLDAKTRKRATRSLYDLTAKKYFEGIPVDGISAVLHANGLKLIQEDNTEFGGFFCGAQGDTLLRIAYLHSRNADGFFIPIENAALKLTWYKMESGRYEIVTYVS